MTRDSSLVAVFACVLGLALAVPAPLRAQDRLTVIISDLHMGPGRDAATGQWLAVEDFRWAEDFAAFLTAVDEAGQGATDLVLNGDTFELWQSGVDDCRREDVELGCSEEEALARLERVVAAHRVEIDALAAFARRADNRVVLVPGDHDLALALPSIARRLEALVAAPDRVRVAAGLHWRSADGAVHVEHGHDIGGDPFGGGGPRDLGGPVYLHRSFGERVVQDRYNRYETRYPVLDNFARKSAGLEFLAAAQPAIADAESIDDLLAILVQPTWQQFRLDLDGGNVEPPDWDLDAVRARGAAFFVESLVPDGRFRALADLALSGGSLDLDPREYGDVELSRTCDFRAALRRARRRLERSLTQVSRIGPPVTECPRRPGSRGSAFEYFWRSRDEAVTARLRAAAGPAGEAAPDAGVRVVVRGHSHLADNGFRAGRDAVSPRVLDAGAWQRTLTPFQAEALMEERDWSEADLLARLAPEDLPACYGAVWIAPYGEDPEPELRFWTPGGRWGRLPRDAAGLETACGGRGP